MTLTAREENSRLRVTLGAGLNAGMAMSKPARVTVDGKPAATHTGQGIELARPFRQLVAQW